MIEFITKGATDALKKELGKYTDKQVAAALSKAINHTIGVANTELNRQIRNVYNIPISELNKGKKSIKSSSNSLTAIIYASKTPLPLALFNPVETTGGIQTRRIGGQRGAFASKKTKSKKTGVEVTVVKGRKKNMFNAFISVSSQKGVGSVIGLGRYSGKFQWDARGFKESRMMSTSVFVPATDRNVRPKVYLKIGEVLPNRIIHELSRL